MGPARIATQSVAGGGVGGNSASPVSVKVRSPDFRQKKFACLPQAGILSKRHRQFSELGFSVIGFGKDFEGVFEIQKQFLLVKYDIPKLP